MPSNILESYEPLKCRVCGADLLAANRERSGIIVFEKDLKSKDVDKFVQCYAVCKGDCDETAKLHFVSKENVTYWEDLDDLQIPYYFLKEVIAVINGLHSGKTIYDNNCLEELKSILVRISQNTLRDQTKEELNRLKSLVALPDWL
ncbi:hypothetical protein PZH32_02370 [Adlercreutzia equolifaciens]|uniref:hypothetical protein n=1 Tax=Adlercreutzia equolifaciens TaxID=446660 RepID=UPI0023AE6E27|nr:hypothetical protein [Adlercreutzia equolifaciens]MDE8701803.1 hypothetical protein [Adlercreutzia equolifaciens]